MEPMNKRSMAGGRYTHRECGPELGAAKQEFKDDADINRIIAKYRRTGVLDQASQAPVFGEDVGFKTYADAFETLERAREQFLRLPPEIRLELGNDPGRYKELSSEDSVRRLLDRIGAKQKRRIAEAQDLVRRATPPSPAPGPGPTAPPVEGRAPGTGAGDGKG